MEPPMYQLSSFFASPKPWLFVFYVTQNSPPKMGGANVDNKLSFRPKSPWLHLLDVPFDVSGFRPEDVFEDIQIWIPKPDRPARKRCLDQKLPLLEFKGSRPCKIFQLVIGNHHLRTTTNQRYLLILCAGRFSYRHSEAEIMICFRITVGQRSKPWTISLLMDSQKTTL